MIENIIFKISIFSYKIPSYSKNILQISLEPKKKIDSAHPKAYYFDVWYLKKMF